MANLRNLPAVDEILLQPEVEELTRSYRRDFIVDLLREVLDQLRVELRVREDTPSREDLMQVIRFRLGQEIKSCSQGTLKEVINGTGVVLHTNLGRAPLGNRAVNYMLAMASRYNNLEFDLEEGERGSRYQHVEELLTRLTGAEAALVVNNNAAAVLLALNTLARDGEVIVSRGQLVEIGGAFRIPEVMKSSGAKLVEVGTTNKTYLDDYAAAITEQTALLFAAHTSNYRIVGFTEEVPLEALVQLGRLRGLPVMQDLGSGILVHPRGWNQEDEPGVRACVATGADVVTFSGDKLLGGPQAGIIVGKKSLVESMKKNQLTRALRVDKLTIAALEGTLIEYLLGDPAQGIPVLGMLNTPSEKLRERAEGLVHLLCQELNEDNIGARVVEVKDMVGGGAYPTHQIPGFAVEIEFKKVRLEDMAHRMRRGVPALVARRQEERMLISVRTLLPGDEKRVVDLLTRALRDEETGEKDRGGHSR
jgi:L-seryl-tRNA(Ser) seleniumtransferase